MSGEEQCSNSPSELQRRQGSDAARAAAQATRRIATTGGHPSPSRRPAATSTSGGVDQHQTSITSPTRRPSASPYYHQHELTTDDSFADERFISTSSWEEAPSFDSEDQRAKPSGTTSSRPYDRRKQFDTTTPTLIDEEEEDEDDSEMLQLHRSYDQGKDAEAEPLFQKALEIRRRVLGEDHPNTANSYNGVAYNLNAQGKTAEAQPLYQKAHTLKSGKPHKQLHQST